MSLQPRNASPVPPLVPKCPIHDPAQLGEADLVPDVEVLLHYQSGDVGRFRVVSLPADGQVALLPLDPAWGLDPKPQRCSLTDMGMRPYAANSWNPTNYVTRAPDAPTATREAAHA